MLGTVANIFKVQDLRNKIVFTVALLMIYRVGFHIPVPGFDYHAAGVTTQSNTPLGRAAEYMQMFTGGTLSRSSLFALGIMPYITASIILMLLGEVIPSGIHSLSDGFDMHYSGDDVYETAGRLSACICGHGTSGLIHGCLRYDGRDDLPDVAR
jgi:preprotein translocase subunit SecY